MYYQVLLIMVSLLKTLHNFDTNVLVVVLRLITVTQVNHLNGNIAIVSS